jgi:hypothetical protein
MSIVLDPFVHRHWDNPDHPGARITSTSKDQFINRVRQFIDDRGGFDAISLGGYAPFCRHVFMPNFTDAQVDCIPITSDVIPLIKTAYRARRPSELPVLIRWVEAADLPGGAPSAAYLDLIFYCRAMLEGESGGDLNIWSLVSIKGQLVDYETPMLPSTALRNALGPAQGGSREPLDPVTYRQAVEFWDSHVSVH